MSQFEAHFNNSKLDVKDEWTTPAWIYSRLNLVWEFTVDAAATSVNRKHRYFWSIYDNGLSRSWKGHVVFCNPPFTKGGYKPWISKAVREFVTGQSEIVMVLPFKPETVAFRKVWNNAHYMIVPYRRIKYVPPRGTPLKYNAATFPSCVVAFTERELRKKEIARLSQIGYVLDLYQGYKKS